MVVARFWKEAVLYILAICFITTLHPYYTWPNALAAVGALVIMVWLFVRAGVFKAEKRKLAALPFLFIVCLYSFFQFTIEGVLSFVIIVFYLASDKKKLMLYERIRNLYAILLIISILVYIAVVWARIDLPYYELLPKNEGKEVTYLQYPFLVVYNNLRNPLQMFRFCCVFDEPGVVGSVATMFLMLEGYKMKNWQNIVIAISGVLSFSLFFFIVSFVYILFFHARYLYNWKFLLVVVGLGVFLFTYESDDFDFQKLVLSRLEIGEDGQLSGDNRSNTSFDMAYEQFINEGGLEVLTGKGVNAHARIAPGIQSYKMMIYDSGLIYVLISLLFYVISSYMVFKRFSKEFFLYVIYILMFYYQRPAFMFEYGEFFLLTLIPYSLKLSMHESRKKAMQLVKI